jgi:DNA-binding SARP family transcriptional activator/predicted ATPase
MLVIRMLGGFEVRVDGNLIRDFQSVKSEALLAYLAYSKKHPVRREGLATLLWPEHEQEKAQTNLRKSLSRLKSALKGSNPEYDYLITDRSFLQIKETIVCEVDALRFEDLLRACPKHQSFHNIECESCLQFLEEALSLYQGDFLENFFVEDADVFDEWLLLTREHLHNAALNAMKHLALYYEFQGNYAQSMLWTRKQLRLEPWLEEAHRQMMRLLAYQGELNNAFVQYQHCIRSLQTHFAAEPSLETQNLAKRIQNLPEKRPHNLPSIQSENLVRRAQAYGRIRQQLVKPNCNLLSLVGIGGTGKTTLALEIAWSLVNEYFGPFVDGVCYLALLETEQRFSWLVTALADFFSISLAQSPQPEKVLFQQLRQKECLLILDNGEYLSNEGKRFIREILQQAPSIKILVPTREALKLSDEWLFTLDGLSLPDNSPSSERELGKESEALALFEQRSQKILPVFHWDGLDPANQEALFQICHLTEGLPLALEMAANWVTKLSCQEIAAEIQNGLDILINQAHDIPDRHRSIRVVFSYSWRLLSEEEQQNLSALAVFSGDFDLEAAFQILGIKLFAISDLIDKSLLKSIVKSGHGYYQMHNLLRQYLHEQIPQERFYNLQNAHAVYYSELLKSQRSDMKTAETSNVPHRFLLELDNLRTSWDWAIQAGDYPLLDSLIDGFYEYYALKGWWQEGLALFTRALVLFQSGGNGLDAGQALIYARLLTRLCQFHYSLGDLGQAQSLIQEAQKVIQLIEEPAEMALIYEKLGSWGILLISMAIWHGRKKISDSACKLSRAIIPKVSTKPIYSCLLGRLQGIRAISKAQKAVFEIASKSIKAWLLIGDKPIQSDYSPKFIF